MCVDCRRRPRLPPSLLPIIIPQVSACLSTSVRPSIHSSSAPLVFFEWQRVGSEGQLVGEVFLSIVTLSHTHTVRRNHISIAGREFPPGPLLHLFLSSFASLRSASTVHVLKFFTRLSARDGESKTPHTL